MIHNIQLLQKTTDLKTNDMTSMESSNGKLGHDLHDQQLFQSEQKQYSFIRVQLRSMKKFDGNGDAEDWLERIMEKFEELQLTICEKNDLIPELLSGKALIWYSHEQKSMQTFPSFITNFLQCYKRKECNQDQITLLPIKPETPVVQQQLADPKDSLIDYLRNQMMVMTFEKLPKFSGTSKQNVSSWLQEIEQTMNILKLTDNEKLLYISLCLEDVAKDCFFLIMWIHC